MRLLSFWLRATTALLLLLLLFPTTTTTTTTLKWRHFELPGPRIFVGLEHVLWVCRVNNRHLAARWATGQGSQKGSRSHPAPGRQRPDTDTDAVVDATDTSVNETAAVRDDRLTKNGDGHA